MKQSDHNLKQVRSFSARMSCAIGTFLLALLLAAPASATYETVSTFAGATSGEGRQLASAAGVAVNASGAGGVPAGTVYAVSRAEHRVVRYSAKGEFREAWGYAVAEPAANEFQRCGPDGEPSHPNCNLTQPEFGPTVYEGADRLWEPKGIAVDQTTGNVYVLNDAAPFRYHDIVQVFNPDGSQLITSFGEGGEKETFDESPEKLHRSSEHSGISVDSDGIVYIFDRNSFSSEARVMVFEPQTPGDYEHYVYAGRSHDIAFGYYNTNPVLDFAGNLYTTEEEKAIYEFNPDEPATPVCEFQEPKGGISAMTVNPQSGEIFYFSFKDKKIHQLSACNPQGEFIETTSFTPIPKMAEEPPLAFNPTLAYEASRPPGVLYAARPNIEGGLGYIFAPPEAFPPSVESESVSSVTSSTATLSAQINPKGSETRYVFQYITDAAYEANEPADHFAGASEAPLGGAVLGSGQETLGAGASLVGLEPDTEYHYRVIATSHCDPAKEEELCEDVGPSQVFRTFPTEAPELPDDRTYELVSPAQKNGGEVFPADPQTASCGDDCKPAGLGFPMQSAPDGEAVVYEGFPFSITDGAANFNEYLARRTASGWQTTILSPFLQRDEGGHKAFNADLTQGVLYQSSPSLSPEAPSEYANLYTQPTGAPFSLTPLIKTEPPNRNPDLTYAGASADFSQLFFEANDVLTGETLFAPEALDPGPGTGLSRPMNLYESVEGQLRLVNVLPGNAETVPGSVFGSGKQLNESANPISDFSHAISDDGSRVFWSSESGQVYVRENSESTRAIPDPGRFLTASADGSKVLLNNGHLYDLETEEPTPQEIADLSQGEGGFEGIVGQSEDLSRIYFVDSAVLAGEEENDQGAKAQAGKHNLYAWHEGSNAFVATLDSGDNNNGPTSNTRGDWLASPSGRTAEASPDGRWVAFLSEVPLTGYDNVGPSCVLNTTGKGKLFLKGSCSEVFLYDSTMGKLTCPSCNPSGARPLGWSKLRLIHNAPGSLPQPRYLTDSGRLYFDSRDSLSPFDTNDGVEDVYQYEPEGIGSCKREGGCVSLISAGHEPVDSNFLAIDATGKNVFFTSRDQLVLKDRDDLIDLYVAREGGGIPAETETATPGCQGEACQPAVVVPNDPTPASSSFEGAGNVVEKEATKKNQKKARKKHRKKKHKNKKRRHKRAANNNRGGAR